MDSASFTSWIEPLHFEISDNILSVTAQNQFSADFIRSVYMNVLESVSSDFGLTLSFGVNNAQKIISNSVNDNVSKSFKIETEKKIQKNTFVNFITSDENAFVLSAAKKMVSGGASFSPLFIYGPSGCGKSLLANCINSESAGRTLMMTGGQFVSEFLRSMREHSVFAFKDFCRNCDTFILDDIQELSGKRVTMDEFLQLIIDLRNQNKNIVLISNASPSNLTGFDKRAQSLFASGLTADITVPNKNVRKTMLVRSGVSIDVADALSGRIDADGHLINGIALKIKTYTELMGERVTIEVAERLLGDILQKNKTPISMVKSMCEKLGVSFDSVCGSGRHRTLVRSRQIMMVALKKTTTLSLSEIGNLIGGRDHATVLYSIAQIEKLKSSDLMLSAEIDQMITECK